MVQVVKCTSDEVNYDRKIAKKASEDKETKAQPSISRINAGNTATKTQDISNTSARPLKKQKAPVDTAKAKRRRIVEDSPSPKRPSPGPKPKPKPKRKGMQFFDDENGAKDSDVTLLGVKGTLDITTQTRSSPRKKSRTVVSKLPETPVSPPRNAMKKHKSESAGTPALTVHRRKRRYGLLPIVDKSEHIFGFVNYGNNCFINASLQCLMACESLVGYFYSNDFAQDLNVSPTKKNGLVEGFAEMIKNAYSKETSILVPQTLIDEFKKIAPPKFDCDLQQDAQEFLRFLISGLHEEVNRAPSGTPFPAVTLRNDSKSDAEIAESVWSGLKTQNDSILFDLFAGLLKSSIRCHNCNNISTTFESFWDLSLPIPHDTKHCSLEDCLRLFGASEILEDKYLCSHCLSEQTAEKQFSIVKAPEILMIHIKRFSPGKRRWIKNTTKVDYPLKLDTTTIKPLLCEKSKDKFNGYRLTGVCCHKGNTAGGHYVSYTKNFEDLKWYKQDDEKVSPACASGHSITAYILFYHKF